MSYREICGDCTRFCEFWRDFLKIPESLRDFPRIPEILRDFTRLLEEANVLSSERAISHKNNKNTLQFSKNPNVILINRAKIVLHYVSNVNMHEKSTVIAHFPYDTA